MNDMMTGIFIGILIGIVTTLIYTNIISVWLELIMELFRYRISEQATFWKLEAERQVNEFNKKYPATKEITRSAIGFHMEDETEEEDYEYEDDGDEE